jgi:hypothetical protein
MRRGFAEIRLLLSTEDTDSSTVQSRVGRRTEATTLLEKAQALGSQAASLESDRVKNLDENVRGGRKKARGFVML